MTRIAIKQLVWDEKNLDHIKEHNVSKREAESGKNILYHKKTYSDRYLAVTRVGPRLISLVLKRQGTGKYYLITARDSSKKERRRVYEIEKKEQNS